MALRKNERPAEKSAVPSSVDADDALSVLREIRDDQRALRERFDSLMDKIERANILGR